MKICVLASGSKGNSTYLETNGTKSLIDIGMSCAYIEKNLKDIGVEPSSIERIFLTHTHSDHIKGLAVFLKKYKPVVYFTEKMDKEMGMLIEDFVYIDNDMVINDLEVKPIKTSHDVADSHGYVFASGDKSLLYMTDTGYINIRNHNKLKNHDLYVLESNHDTTMLMEGKYPYHLKQRIIGSSGHLSNEQSATYLAKFTTKKTKNVVLVHLSEENNTPEKALETFYKIYEEYKKIPPRVLVAKQKERTEFIEV